MRLRLHHVGVFRHAQRYVQEADHVFLGFTVSGVIYSRNPGGSFTGNDVPYLSLLLPGETTDFEFGADRENWVVQFDSPDLRRHAGDPAQVQFRTDRVWVGVPRVVRLGVERVPGWREQFRAMREALASPLPVDRLRAELGVLSTLRTFVDSGAGTRTQTPAQEFRRMIDEDAASVQSLEEMARRAGYSSDHLRRLFEAELGIGPQAYRVQRRLAVVMDLIANSRLTVKEMAVRTGFRHVSHLSASFKAAFGLTPREAIARYRYGK